VSTWSLQGLRGNDVLVRVLQRGLVESVDSPIPWEKWRNFLALSLVFAFTFEHTPHDDLWFA
jgi:hypothetical protein